MTLQGLTATWPSGGHPAARTASAKALRREQAWRAKELQLSRDAVWGGKGEQEEGRWAGPYWKEWIPFQRLQDARQRALCPGSARHNFGNIENGY